MANEEKIKSEIKTHIDKEGSKYSTWYVGISEDPKNRLFNEHCVNEKNGWWIYRKATSSAAARRIEDYFINKIGTDGGSGGGDENCVFVYAYKKGTHTNP